MRKIAADPLTVRRTRMHAQRLAGDENRQAI